MTCDRQNAQAKSQVRTGLNEENPKRVPFWGTFHMLRHFFVTALIQSEM
jgi:hypothetical protein